MRLFLRIAVPLLLILAVAGVLTLLSERRAAQGPGSAHEGRAQVPNDWFAAQRALPGLEVPLGAVRRARDQALALDRDASASSKSSVGPAWAPAGPTNTGGRITAIGTHPSLGSTYYVGAAAGGVWLTTNDGATWTPVFDGAGSPSIGAVAIAPWGPSWVFVGTGEANGSGDSFDGDGLWMSANGGVSWSHLGLEATRHIARIALDPADSSRFYVAASGPLFTKDGNRGIYRTTNRGATWERTLFVSDSTSAIDVVIEPGNPAVLYAAMWERLRRPGSRRVGGVTSGVYKSTDFGQTWALLSNGLPAAGPSVGRIGLSASVSSPGTLVAIYADDPGNFAGVYRTTNGGSSWTRLNDGALSNLFSNFGWYFANVRIDPTNANRIFALGVSLYRTTNGGTSWSSVGGSMHVDHHDLWIDPTNASRVLAGNDGGSYRSTNGGTAWTMAPNLPITQFYAICVDAQNAARRYGGTQDNGTNRTTTGGTSDWENIYGGDGFYCLVDPTNSAVIYAEYQYGGLGKSTDDGDSFSDATNGIPFEERRNWSTPVVMDPSNPQVLYTGTYRVWRTTNGTNSWSAISGDLTGGVPPSNLVYRTVTTIAVAPSNPSVLYAGTDDARVWVTTNAGAAWTQVDGSLPDHWVTRVAVDPADDAVAYVALSGYREDIQTPHLFRTTNHGASWTALAGNLPDAPVNALIIDPIQNLPQPRALYAGTDVGVFVTYDLGVTWAPLGAGLTAVPVNDLALHAASRTLLAGTHGRSISRITLPASPTAVPSSGSPASHLALSRPSPNPTRSATAFELALERDAEVHATVYDVSGRRVREILRSRLAAGRHRIEWDGTDDAGARVGAGAYFLRASAEGGSASRKITIVD